MVGNACWRVAVFVVNVDSENVIFIVMGGMVAVMKTVADLR